MTFDPRSRTAARPRRAGLRRAIARSLCLLAALSAMAAAHAEQVAPFVVSPQRDVARMMALADVGPEDYLIDLGSGDGRIVIAAARRGALAHGVEIDPDLNVRARAAAQAAGVADRVAFLSADLFESDFRHATVVTLYLFPDANLRLRPLLLEQLRPGTRVLSNSFDMGDWRPDEHVDAATSGGILLWIIPADVAGDWSLRIGGRRWPLRLFQTYQDIGGELGPERTGPPDGDEGSDEGSEGAPAPRRLEAPMLSGARIRFDAVIDGVTHRFAGQVDGDAMTGTLQRRGDPGVVIDAWTALRSDEGNDD